MEQSKQKDKCTVKNVPKSGTSDPSSPNVASGGNHKEEKISQEDCWYQEGVDKWYQQSACYACSKNSRAAPAGEVPRQSGSGVAVCVAAAEEYVAFEILEMAGNITNTRGDDAISEVDIIQSIFKDKEMADLLGECLNT